MGTWRDDKRVGYFETTLYDGVVMKGDYINGKEEGQFEFSLPNGKTYRVYFEDGVRLPGKHDCKCTII